jgi:hypothetical protein
MAAHKLSRSFLLLALSMLPHTAQGLSPTTLSLGVSSNPSTFGAPITLTATVTPSNATGRVTFYDGVTILGTKPLSGGSASFLTGLLPSGPRKLRAYYGGDSINAAATSNVVAQTVNARPTTSLTPAPSSWGSNQVVVGDFNGDGIPDLATSYLGTMTTLLGSGGDAGFHPVTVNPSILGFPLAVADFNGDGKADLLVQDQDPSTGFLYVLAGNGDGTFQAGIKIAPIAIVVVGDFNGDGKPDLAMSAQNGVSILLGNGDGTFQAPVLIQSNFLPTVGTILAVGDFNGDGKADLAAGNQSTVSILLGRGDGTFQAPLTNSALTQANSIVVADFNKDGKADLVTLSFKNKVSVQLGNGDGTFQAPVLVYAAPLAMAVSVGDFNGDGNNDLAIGNVALTGSSNISVLQGNGDGTFQSPIATQVNVQPYVLISGDFNGDGKTDLLTGGTLLLGSNLSLTATTGTPQSAPVGTTFLIPLRVILLDGGNPVIGATITFTAIPSANGASAVMPFPQPTTDASGGAPVIANANQIPGSYQVRASYQGLTATFSLTNTAAPPALLILVGGTQQSAALGTPFPNPFRVKLTDLAGNPVSGVTVTFTPDPGALGAVLSSRTALTDSAGLASVTARAGNVLGPNTITASVGPASATFIVFSGLPSTVTLAAVSPNPSTFGALITLTATVSPSNATGRMIFYDGVTMLGVRPLSGGSASFLTGLLAVGPHKLRAYYLAGTQYAAASSNVVTQTVNAQPANTFSVRTMEPLPSALPGDFNGDGLADFAVLPFNSTAGVRLGSRDGFFQPIAITPPVSGLPMAIGDFDIDGNADLLVRDTANNLEFLKGNGNGTFQPGVNTAAPVGSYPAVGDFDGDGRPDLAIASTSGVTVLLNAGGGTFLSPVVYRAGPAAITAAVLAMGDFNGDGFADLAVRDGDTVSILLGKGDGSFQAPLTDSAPTQPFTILVADLNRDGKADLITTSSQNQVSVQLGKGNGTFQSPVSYTPGFVCINTGGICTVPLVAAVADFNGDGIADIAIANAVSSASTNNVSILRGNGDGTFQAPINYQADSPTFLIAGDFNGDGKTDLYAGGTLFLGANLSLTATGGTPQTTNVGTAFPVMLQATVKDASGAPVSGVTVAFTAPASGASAGIPNANAVTNAAGVASVIAVVNDIAGSYSVTATMGPLSISFQLTNTALAPASIVPTGGAGQSALLGQHFLAPLQATVKDAAGNLLSGVIVTFTAPVSGASALLSGPVSVTTELTNAAGVASQEVSANIIPGSYVVTASAGGVTASFSLTNAVGASTFITPTTGTPQSALIGTSFAVPLQVIVKNSIATPISGVTVTFTAPSGGASAALSSATAVTNALGIASVTATANSISGNYIVTASTGGISASFLLTNLLASGAYNLALGRPATQSSTLPGTAGAAAAVDGNTDGGFFNGSVTHTNFENNAWWQVDLGTAPNISSVVIWNRTDCCAERLNDYWIFFSNTPFLDSDTPATLKSRLNTVGVHQTDSPHPFTSIPTNLGTRYVRVQLSGANNLSLAEVQVFGAPTTALATDLALGKPATQSSTLAGYPSAIASSAVDGNTGGNFFDGSVTHTNADANAWWQVDLGASSSVSSVVVWNRTDDCCQTRLSDYWVFVSDTPFQPTDTPATLQNRAGTFASHQTLTPYPSVSIVFGAQGRYVRVQLNGTNNLSLAEVQVFGAAGAVTNLAIGKPATQSSTLSGYATASAGAAVDGNTNGGFFSGSVTHTNADTNAWWQLDLGASATVSSIVVWNRTDCCAERLTDYWVFVSDTPFLSTDNSATLFGRPGVFASHQTSAPNPSATIPGVAVGRYVRVQLSGTGNLSLAEVQVFGTSGSTAPTNLAQGKAALQSSTLPGYPNDAASAAVDGNPDGNFFHGSVTHTNADSNAWWQVDLGASATISSVVVWNRTDCCNSRLNDYWIFVSDTPFLATDTPATLQGRAGTFVSHQASAPSPFSNIPFASQGRYVRVQLSGTNNLSLAEVQVFGQ